MGALYKLAALAALLAAGATAPTGAAAPSGRVMISSVKELAACAERSGQTVIMVPGWYRFTDYLPASAMAERRKRQEWPLLVFSGSNNVFQLDGVTIEVDTALRKALRPPMHTSEFVVAGNSNVLRGLTLTNLGDGVSPGGAALSITGRGNTIRDCTLWVRGSFPYGYGDLFGKGGPDVIGPLKKSGLHIAGSGTRVTGCKLFMRAFGHGYFVQQDASDVSFEDCTVEGEMRPTTEMLAETNGPAFKVGFRTVAKNRQGENKVMPGYMKSLAEDGFRTYGTHTNLTLKNCTAKNMRGGFELRTKTAVRLENCAALGCERGFWISTGATLSHCRGDAQYGPLLFAEGDNARVDLELLPAESAMTVHALASIQGSGNQITIKPSPTGNRTRPAPILVGYGTPMMGEGMAPIPERDARNLVLRNETAMPVVIGAKANGGEIVTRGPVTENKGRNIVVQTR